MPPTKNELQQAREVRALLGEIVEAKGRDYVYKPPPADLAPEALHLTGEPDLDEKKGCAYLAYDVTDEEWLVPERYSSTIRNVLRNSFGVPLRVVGAGCVVGHLMIALDAPKDQIASSEGLGAVTAIANLFGPDVPEAVREALGVMQRYQDQGSTWGEALDQFDMYLRMYGYRDLTA